MFCMHCGQSILDDARFCQHCGGAQAATGPTAPTRAGTPVPGDQKMLRMLIPVDRSGLAVAAGYMGLFSFFLLPAPIALLLGILALRDIGRHPEKVGKPRAIFGIVMGVLGCVFLAITIVGALGNG